MPLHRLALPLLLVLAGPAHAAPAPAPTWLLDGDGAYEQLVSEQSAGFAAMDARFREARRLAPEDQALALAHCSLYSRIWDLDYAEWAVDIGERHESCLAELEATWPDTPAIQVYLAENRWGAEHDRAALLLWKFADDWPDALRARLASRLANADDIDGTEDDYAVAAVRLGVGQHLPQAVRHLAATEGAKAAVALAAKAPVAESDYQLNERLKALLELPDRRAARDHLRRHEPLKLSASPELAARSLIKAGDLPGAERQLARATEKSGTADPIRVELALARGDARAAAEHFDFDTDAIGASTQTYALIVRQNPLLALSLNLLPGTVTLVAMALLLMLLPLSLLMPVHYRGLARRAAGRMPAPLFPELGLRHAWYALAMAMLVLPLLAVAVFSPQHLAALIDDDSGSGPHLFPIMLWGTIASLVAMLPTLYWLRRPQWFAPLRELPRMGLHVLVAYALAFGIGMLTVMVANLLQEAGVDPGSSVFQQSLQQQGIAQYGLATTFLLMAVLVPVFEEWLFRGVLLGGLARHISFGWANTLQACLFMLIHDDVSRFPFYFAIGLLAGWLVRRHRCLLPAVLLHVINNAVAVWLGL